MDRLKRASMLSAAAAGGLRFPVQELEARIMLASNAIGPIATSIAPSIAITVHLAPGTSLRSIAANSSVAQQQYFRFAVDSGAFDGTVRFDLDSPAVFGGADGALALYDEAGNLITSTDADLGGEAWKESLAVTLESGRAYILGVLAGPTLGSQPFNLTATAEVQPTNRALTISPSTGAVQFSATGGEDPLNSTADVDYFNLNLTNGAASGSVTVTPIGLDGRVSGTLFRRANNAEPWRPVATAGNGTGAALNLSLSALSPGSLTDAQFMLAVSSFDYAGPARSYQINVAAQTPLLAPATTNPAAAEPAGAFPILAPDSLGNGELKYSGSLASGGQRLFKFHLPQSGPVSIDAASQLLGFDPVLSLYDASGRLLEVRSRTSFGTVALDLSLKAGDYVVGIGDVGNDEGGPFSLTIEAPYVAQTMVLTPPTGGKSVTTVNNLIVGSGRATQYFRIDPAAGMDILSIGFTAGAAGGATIGIAGPSMSTIERTVDAGKTVVLPLTVFNRSGPFDIYVVGTGADSTCTLRVGQLDVPDTIDPDDLVSKKIDLSGDIASSQQPAVAFGAQTGIRFYQLLTLPDALTNVSVSGVGGAVPLFARYEESGGLLRLKQFELPDTSNGTSSQEELTNTRLQGLVAYSLGFSGAGSVALAVNGPDPEAIGVGMVPDPPPDLPENPTQGSGPWYSKLSIRNVVLDDDFEQHLWKTLVPANVRGITSIQFDPNGSQLRAKVTMYNDLGGVIGSGTSSSPGQTLNVTPIAGLSLAAIRGREVLFRVEPLDGQPLGDGAYDLEMVVETDNPHPFEVLESAWTYPGRPDTAFPEFPSGVGVIDVIQDPSGDGSAQGNLTSNAVPLTSGGIDVFRFWAFGGPVRVWTSKSTISGVQANTNLRLYKAHFDAQGSIDYIAAVPNSPPSFDWFPADRSTIDAQAYFNSFDEGMAYTGTADQYDDGGGMYFAVVKGQEGTTGRYVLNVDAPDMPILGGSKPGASTMITYDEAKDRPVDYLPSTTTGGGGSAATLKLNYVTDITDFLGYFAIQLPDFHNGTLTISGTPGGLWEMQLYDTDGNRLGGTVATQGSGANAYSEGTFNIDPGPQPLILRLRERQSANAITSYLALTTTLALPAGVAAPSTAIPIENYRTMVINPRGDGSITDTVSAANSVRSYAFKAPPLSPLTVSVLPTTAGADKFRWMVYVDGLKAWEQTRNPATDGSGSTRLWLPDGDVHDVVVRVLSADADNAGQFVLTVFSDSDVPLAPISTSITDGTSWRKIYLQDGTQGTVNLTINPVDAIASTTTIRYFVYSADGATPVTSGQATINAGADSINVPMPSSVVGGKSYYVRAGLAADAKATLRLSFDATYPKLEKVAGNFIFRQPVDEIALEPVLPQLARLNTRPDGTTAPTTYAGTGSDLAFVGFWVEKAGTFRLNATLTNAPSAAISLYKGRFSTSGELTKDYDLELYDFANVGDNLGNNQYQLDSYLEPGMYAVKVERSPSATGTGQALLEFDTPDHPIQDIVIDPNSGKSFLPHLWAIDDAEPENPLIEGYRTRVYRAVAPAGSQGPVYGTLRAFDAGPGVENGSASMRLFREGNGVYTQLGFVGDTSINPPANGETAVMNSNSKAEPFREYYLMFDRNMLANRTAVAIDFDVPQSGTPDLQVDPLKLSPNNGQTQVDITVRNGGYAVSGATNSRYEFSDTSKNPEVWTTSDRFEAPLGPFAEREYALPWLPVTINDEVRYTTDFVAGDADGNLEELDETNNTAEAILSSVDKHAPVVTLALADPLLDGNPAADVWGRYVHGVFGVRTDVLINVSDADDVDDTDGDGESDLYRTRGYYPVYNPPQQQDIGPNYTTFGAVAQHKIVNFDFGALRRAHGGNPNQFIFWSQDKWGVIGDQVIRTAQVVEFPGWMETGSGATADRVTSSIEFNPETRRYEMTFHNALVDQHGTLNQITGANLPFIGGLDNVFLAEIFANGSASLNPNEAVTADVSAHAQITVLGEDVLNETYSSNQPVADHVSIQSQLVLDKLTLDADLFKVTFRLTDFPLLNFQSPKIPLFAYGVPGVASITANLQFSLDAEVDAAISLAIRPSQDQSPTEVGFASPTFIGPTVTAGLTISGDVEFIGFDLASLSGTINFGITPRYGLITPPDQFVPFDEFFSHDAIDIVGELYGEIAAEVLGFEVFSFDLPSVDIDFTDGPPVVTGAAVPAAAPGKYDGIRNMPGGDAPVGTLRSNSRPGIVVDPATGKGIFLRVVDVDGGPATRNNLAFATRASEKAAWTAQQTIADGSVHVSNPQLALTRDGANTPAVAVYQAITTGANVANLSRNQLLTGQDLRYRYFNGTTWGAEQAVATDSLYDADHSLAFNAGGQGVLAWVQNTSSTPIAPAGAASPGTFTRSANEIRVANWNPATHTFGAPLTLTNDAIGDGRPATFAAADGTLYVVWIKDNGVGNQAMFSRFTGGSWSAPAVLQTTGLPNGGKLQGLAIGGDAAGRIHVLLAHSVTNSSGRVTSRLYGRSTTAAAFGQSASAEIVADDANFSSIKTTNAPDGSLVAYWQQGDGVVNDIYGVTRNATTGTWGKPVKLTAGPDHEIAPSVAVDTNGQFLVAYEVKTPPPSLPGFPSVVGHPDPVPSIGGLTAGVGVGTTAIRILSELGFTRKFAFERNGDAPTGSSLNGHAQIINRGTAADRVLVEYLENATVVGSQTIQLNPGQTFDIEHAFVIKAGANKYSVRLTPYGGDGIPGGPEVFGAGDNTSTAAVTGTGEITVESAVFSNSNPAVGSMVIARVRNLATTASGGFRTNLYRGDPSPATLIGQVDVASIPGGGFTDVAIPWSLPASGGKFVLCVLADAQDVIGEVNEDNNLQYLVVVARPQPAAVTVGAEVIDYSGKDNVRVRATVTNSGVIGVRNMPVTLRWARDDGGFVDVATTNVPSLVPGASIELEWVADGLAGRNRYSVVLGESPGRGDADFTDNVAETTLVLQGLADLKPLGFALSALPQQREDLKVGVRVFNSGIADAAGVLVQVYAQNRILGQLLVGSLTIDSLPALTNKLVQIPIDTSLLVGDVDIVIVVDGKEKILETSDLNNRLTIPVTFAAASTVLSRLVFYNNSARDGRTPGASLLDDGAIDATKSVMRPLQQSGPENITPYSRGINGVMVDVENFVGTPNATHFRFRVLRPDGVWANAPTPQISMRQDVGFKGSDRITMIWPDEVIKNQWLEVSVLAGPATSLKTPDVFYIGNLVGDGDGDGTVATPDFARLSKNFNHITTDLAMGDFNADGVVGFDDFQTLELAFSHTLAPLFAPPPAAAPAVAAPTGTKPRATLPTPAKPLPKPTAVSKPPAPTPVPAKKPGKPTSKVAPVVTNATAIAIPQPTLFSTKRVMDVTRKPSELLV